MHQYICYVVHLHLKAQKKAFKKGPEIAFKMSRKSIKKQPLWLSSPLPVLVFRAAAIVVSDWLFFER